MTFASWMRPTCRVVLEDADLRFEVEGDGEFVERALRAFLRHQAERPGTSVAAAAQPRMLRAPQDGVSAPTNQEVAKSAPAIEPAPPPERTRKVRVPELRSRERTRTELIPGRNVRRMFSDVTQPAAPPSGDVATRRKSTERAPVTPAPAPKAPTPKPMVDEATMQEVVATGGVHSWRKRRSTMRLHAMDGGMSKVYAVSPSQLAGSRLFRHVSLERIGNIYVEQGLLSRRMRGDSETVWHAMVPTQP